MKTLNLILSKYCGPCHGIFNTFSEVMKYNFNVKILGEIAHNDILISELAKKPNIEFINDISEVNNNDSVVIRTHGISIDDLKYLVSKDIHVFDQTCNNVKFVQKIAEECNKRSSIFILVGNPNHPEVIGIESRCKNTYVIDSIEGAKNFVNSISIGNRGVIVASQTTFDDQKFIEICSILKEKIVNIKIYNTVCGDSLRRRNEIVNVSSFVDSIIVVGSEKSSNSVRLFRCSKELIDHTFMADDPQKFDFNNISCARNLFITSGASVLKKTVIDLVKLTNKFFLENETNINLKQII